MMAGDDSAGRPRAARRARWWQLSQRWRMVGVFEIDSKHEFYSLTSMMKEGLQACIQNTEEQDSLTDAHFKTEDVQQCKGFEMHAFAATVFSALRRSLDISEQEFLDSLCSDANYLQFISNSKSKADFFLTNDKRFFLKTQNEREIRFLLSNLPAYMEHLEKYPHSLMVRFLGVHQIVVPNQLKKYFIVMQSVFYPDERINIRYDIKGCEVGRWTDPEAGGEQIIKVLKDNNFRGQSIALGPEKSWFARQVKADAAFLQELNVLDYSLLLAHQPLHQDELDGKHSFADLILRTTKSLDLDDRPTDPDPCHVPLLHSRSEDVQDGAGCGSEGPEPTQETMCDAELKEFHEHNRRLLPNFKNAIHVIDGADRRYFVGIVDIFTVYSLRKRLENLWKNLRFPGRDFSTVSPVKYSQRFCRWIQQHTQ
ncbi:phosphatidylinositol 4-phosphate 5-kinase-like protein 1 isoform X1 [Cyprinodon tularosa]|uniref:phosphatidylinositol 4-phosphate 5-kinase-like protein 1 isoform X1 n=2 Tax=Cyprinodon tularosa TaxID=77115 RepID=UPI0018E20D13|nr:phosphatidylinositol 4-phosphate 5-kinase-like protein 1 isoform X1 [Cyprinodon tularosa]